MPRPFFTPSKTTLTTNRSEGFVHRRRIEADENDQQRKSSTHRRHSSRVTKAFSGSGSALSDSPSNSFYPTRSKDSGRIPLSTLNLTNESRPAPRIKILDLRAEIEGKPTMIDETSSSVLKYKTPQFKSHVTFQMGPIDENQSWKVGWIQACTHMEFFSKDRADARSSTERIRRYLRRLRIHVVGIS